MESYVTVNGKKYRKGYTTGSCAAAASKAAVLMLLTGKTVHNIEIDTPADVRLNLPVSDAEITGEHASCAVIKDGGDDPDMTTGLKIFAHAQHSEEADVSVLSGEGIGMVTLPGLKVHVGQPAINPVPMKMILKEVKEVLPAGTGVKITLSVPGGEAVALKTYNPRLGIVGGISILGTTGIVNPMSEEAWKESLALEISMLASKGCKQAVFTFGNYGNDFSVEKLGIDKNRIINMSNFVGYMIDKAVEAGFERILMVGHPGKLVKVAAGIFHTHSRVADARMEIMAAYAALEGADTQTVKRIYECRTTNAAADIIISSGLTGVFDRIAANVTRRCDEYTFHKIKFGTVLFSEDNTLLSMCEAAEDMLKE